MRASRKHRLVAALAAWLIVLSLDLFVNAGLLGSKYTGADPVLVSNIEAARRIPIAYGVWAIQVAALQWLLNRLDVRRMVDATRYGATAGFLSGGLSLIALWTIVRLDPVLTAAWILAATAEGVGAGTTLTYISRAGARGLYVVVPTAIAVVIAAFVLQNVR